MKHQQIIQTIQKTMKKIDLPDADIIYFPQIFKTDRLSRYFSQLEKLPDWKKHTIKVGGRECLQNRLTCYYAEEGLYLSYSGKKFTGHKFPSIVLKIKKRVEELLNNKYTFNYCLLNNYPDGNSNIGMHSDDETNLNGPIASVSIGAERFFDFASRDDPQDKIRLTLNHGSLIVMGGDTQKNYKHGVPVQKRIKDRRINLTFRIVKC